MKIFKILFIVLFIGICSNSVNSQRVYTQAWDDPLISKELLFIDNLTNSLIIDQDFTTNKEYLTYLTWVYNVWIDYPENYQKALPNPKFNDKLFDPEFAHEAVKGVNLEQAQNYCKWRADRFNEWILIREGLQYFDFLGQVGEENFCTESYLCGQFQGVVKGLMKDPISNEVRKSIYRDYFFIPSFHVASKEEIDYANSMIKDLPELISSAKKSWALDKWLIAYFEFYLRGKQAETTHPLQLYYDKYIAEKGKINDDKLVGAKKFIASINKQKTPKAIQLSLDNVLLNPRDLRLEKMDKFAENIFYSRFNIKTTLNPFDVENQGKLPEKNMLGQMPFIWIADEMDGTPILIKGNEINENNYEEVVSNTTEQNEGFYCAVNIPYRIYLKKEYRFALFGKRYLYKK